MVVDALEASVENVKDSAPFDYELMPQAQLDWRKKGAIGRFHNVVVFIRSSPQRREAFKRCLLDTNDGELSRFPTFINLNYERSTGPRVAYHVKILIGLLIGR